MVSKEYLERTKDRFKGFFDFNIGLQKRLEKELAFLEGGKDLDNPFIISPRELEERSYNLLLQFESYNLGRRTSNIMRDFQRSKLNILDFNPFLNDLNRFIKYSGISESRGLKWEKFNQEIEENKIITVDFLTDIAKSNKISRDLSHNYTQRWIFYNKLFGEKSKK
ncbi:MAG: hypothetical protein KC516_04150 [Nanoarchaeota archaeon]|nr:hypothetical protein [Nanoarchaeota archaeon]